MLKYAHEAFELISKKVDEMNIAPEEVFGKIINGKKPTAIAVEEFMNIVNAMNISGLTLLHCNCLIKVLSSDNLSSLFIPNDTSHSNKKESKIVEEILELSDTMTIIILFALTEYMMRNNAPLYNLFGDVIYKKTMNSKGKDRNVELIASENFFAVLQKIGIELEESEHENLKQVLCIDQKYLNEIHVRKLKAAVQEFATNEELKELAKSYYQEALHFKKEFQQTILKE
eukprot:TRINITY_DN6903_c0_g2_i1.p1 TRINITY_DN6903_c0_g2~~TRINITY_DN6903_c0_g2_i1.p1  ORF type:complete len:229 (+),score=39.09 TRINITY_DN6903_c0_g2_i1:116-802(+)